MAVSFFECHSPMFAGYVSLVFDHLFLHDLSGPPARRFARAYHGMWLRKHPPKWRYQV